MAIEIIFRPPFFDFSIPVLFTCKNSVYKDLDYTDCFDIDRNALSYNGRISIVAHPPCRLWGKMAHFSTALPVEKYLGIFAVEMARLNGGVVEHPVGSSLFREMKCGTFMAPDSHGGYVVSMNQSWYGHPCMKPTLLYVCGVPRKEFIHHSPNFVLHSRVIKSGVVKGRRPQASRLMRVKTPLLMASYLLLLARLAEKAKRSGV